MFTLSEAAPCWRSTTRALPSYRGASCPPRRNVPGTPVAYRSPREQSRAVRPSDGVDNRSPSSPPPSPGVTDDGGHLGGGGTGVRHRRPAARGSDPSAQVLQRRLPSRRARGLCPGGCRRRPATASTTRWDGCLSAWGCLLSSRESPRTTRISTTGCITERCHSVRWRCSSDRAGLLRSLCSACRSCSSPTVGCHLGVGGGSCGPISALEQPSCLERSQSRPVSSSSTRSTSTRAAASPFSTR